MTDQPSREGRWWRVCDYVPKDGLVEWVVSLWAPKEQGPPSQEELVPRSTLQAAEAKTERIKMAVRECDSKAEKLDHPSEDRIAQYRLQTGPWHRLLALAGPGTVDKSEAELWRERAKTAEAQRGTLLKALNDVLRYVVLSPSYAAGSDEDKLIAAVNRAHSLLSTQEPTR